MSPAHAGSPLADFSTLKMEAIRSSETSHTRSTRRHIPEDSILQSHPRENLKSYKNFKCYVLTIRIILIIPSSVIKMYLYIYMCVPLHVSVSK
jgi:hypothetical protein